MSGVKLLGLTEPTVPPAYVEIQFRGADSYGHLFTLENDRSARRMFGGTADEWLWIGYDARMDWRRKAYEAKR